MTTADRTDEERIEAITDRALEVLEESLRSADPSIRLGAMKAWLGYAAKVGPPADAGAPSPPGPGICPDEANERLRLVSGGRRPGGQR